MINSSQMSLGFNLAAALLCISNLVHMHIHGRTDRTNNRLFIVMLYIVMINGICGAVTSITDPIKLENDTSWVLQRAFRYIYFITHTALCPLLYYYVGSVVGRSISKHKLRAFVWGIPFFITELLVLSNIFTRSVWYYDEHLEFHRNWGEMLIYLAAALYYVLSIYLIVYSWNVLSAKRKTTLFFCFGMVLIGVLIQLFFKWLRVEILFEAVGLTGTMMSIENDDDRMNASLGIYNRQALGVDLAAAIRNYGHLPILSVRITNKDNISRMTGSDNINLLYAQVCEFFKTLVPRYSVYETSPGDYVLLLFHMDEAEVDEMVRCVDERMHKPWYVGDVEIPVTSVLMVTETPEKIKTVDELFYMVDSPLPHELEKTVLEEEDLDFLMRRAAVESAVTRGLDEGSFEVYYQPTYHIDGTLHGAEALLRMHDSEIGNVFPDEFIPVAEQIGFIDDVDDFVLREVCQFIRTGIPKANGMDGINVNLSVLQCMKSGFVEHINEIVEKEGVHKDFLNFEITESVAATDYKLLSRVVKDLKKEGFLFSMDDYGTGYSNMHAIFSLNLDVIKIDKSILWGAEKSDFGRIILENSVRMIRQMKKKILVEGVETESQVELLRGLGVDYLQGYYFSKPVPKDEFIALIGGAA